MPPEAPEISQWQTLFLVPLRTAGVCRDGTKNKSRLVTCARPKGSTHPHSPPSLMTETFSLLRFRHNRVLCLAAGRDQTFRPSLLVDTPTI